MAKLTTINDALAEALMITGSFKGLMDGFTLTLYSAGSGVPANADVAITDQVALCAIAGLNFNTTAPSGVLQKEAAAWSGTNNAFGADTVAAFCRLTKGSYVIQGTVGLAGCNVTLPDILLVASAAQPVNSCAFAFTKSNAG